MTINQLETYLSQRLTNLSNLAVYNRNPKDLAEFPYIVFKITGMTHEYSSLKTTILEIDYWNDNLNDSEILIAADNICNGRTVDEIVYVGLNKSTQDETNGFYKCDIDWEGFIPDKEKNILRYNQRYILKVV